MAIFDNDAKSCYDRIIAGLALLICMSWGMPADACAVHGLAIAMMRHYIKTATGISADFFTSDDLMRLFGSGQGSGGSPPLWLVVSVILLRCLENLCHYRLTFCNVTQTETVSSTSAAFVDDTTNGLNDALEPCPVSATVLAERLEIQAQTWERLLHTCGVN